MTSGMRSRAQHPRRLAKGVSREQSWEDVDMESPTKSYNAPNSPESSLLLLDADFQDSIDSVIALGERIGQEVEDFAVKVDQWLRRRAQLDDGDSKSRFESAMELLGEIQSVARNKHARLERDQSRRNKLSSSWQGRIQGVQDRAARRPSGASGNDPALQTSSEDGILLKELRQWQAEVNSWDLMKTVTDLEVNKSTPEEKALYEAHNPTHKFTSDADLWTHFMFLDDAAREKKLILEWLERNAQNGETKFDTIVEQLEARAGTGKGIWSHGWLNTREKIKAYKRMRSVSGATPSQQAMIRADSNSNVLVTQLDPDAPARQDRNLEKQDEYIERSRWLACYEMLRRGQPWEKVREWCSERNEGWRAASLGTAQDLERKNSRLCLAGPYAGALWRRMCFSASQQVTADKYERAVYGLLAGDVSSVEPVCQSWEDWLYANFNSLLLGSFEDWLQRNHPDRFPSVLAQKFPLYRPVRTSDETEEEGANIMQRILEHPKFAHDAGTPMKMIQAILVAHDFEGFAMQLGIALAAKANAQSESKLMQEPPNFEQELLYAGLAENWDVIRIAAHMLIIYRELGMEFHGEMEYIVENILVAYIDFLKVNGKYDAIPTYARCIRQDSRRSEVLGIMLFDITNDSEQDKLVKLMAGSDLDLASILSEQYVNACRVMGLAPGQGDPIARFEIVEPSTARWAGWRVRSGFARGSAQAEPKDLLNLLTYDEARVVRALEWFFRVQAQWSITFIGIAFVLKQFLRTGRFLAALAVTRAVPARAMSKHLAEAYLGKAIDVFNDQETAEEANFDLRRSARTTSHRQTGQEQDSDAQLEYKFKLYLLTQQSRQCLEMQELCNALEALAVWRHMEERISETPKSFLDTQEIQEAVAETLEDLDSRVQPLLHDWLTHIPDEEDVHDYELIRQAYLPDIILAYNGALSFAADFLGPDVLLKSVNLANTIADEGNAELAAAFMETNRMTDLVTSLALSSRRLLRVNQNLEMEEKKAQKAASAAGKQLKPKRKKSSLKKREWMGETLDIWDPNKTGR